MKDNRMILRQFTLLLVLLMVVIGGLNGQSYKLGDLYTFKDGSVGVVFYVNPDDPGSGTVAALNDLDGQYALWTGSAPPTLSDVFVANGGVFFNEIRGWEKHGKQFTQALRASGVSPAANAVDVSAGWYIPDILQLHKLCASTPFLKGTFEKYGGDIMSLWNTTHWSSTRLSKTSNSAYALRNALWANTCYGTQSFSIRLVRDFPDTAEVYAFWVENAPQSDTVVSPDTTSAYNAIVIYQSDTLPLTATVTVHQPLLDTVRHYAFMNQVEDERITVDGLVFTGITGAGTYELRDTLMAANGCDSLVTILLTVGNNVRYTDTLCPLKDDYYFAPFDTVFAVGTVSGQYEHHGVKLIDGVSVDTVAYYELTILPEHQRFDTVRRCLYEAAETWPYEGNAHVSIAVNGTAVTVVSDTDAVLVEEVAPGTDYNLKMRTLSGCDSVTHLHLDLRRVSRDTVYKDMLITQLAGGESTVACHTFTGITASGTYAATDTLISSDGCDSIITVYLTVEPLHTETLCDSVLAADLTWTSNLSGYTWNGLPLPTTVGESGYYEFPGQKTLDGGPVDTVSYLQLVVNQKYESRDTVSFCLYEPTFTTEYVQNSAVTITVDAGDGITVTSSDVRVAVVSVPGSVTDFALKMQKVSGCDSVVFLHVDISRVSRDTVRHYAFMNQVEDERITVDGLVFTGITGAGTYELRDTLMAANGCDSLVTILLTVGNNVRYTDTLCPLKTDFYFAPFDTVFAVGTVSGQYEHHGVKLIDGVPVDTVAYYELTILPEHQRFDTVRWCLYEVAETWPYDGNAHVSIAVNGAAVTVASDTDAVVVEEVAPGTDYNLKMRAVSGCDSVTHLHLDLRRVSRDTVYKDMLITQLAGGESTVACHTFTGITASGTYAATDTLISSDGCDSLMTVYLTVEPLHTETLCDSVLSADLTWTSNLSGYTWNGLPLPTTVGASGYYEFPGQKTLDGGPVDTVSYLQLVVNQKYEGRDMVSFCLYEPTFTTTYDQNSVVGITVDAGDGITVTSSDAGVAVLPMPGSVTDFALKMQTESGCDSVVFLHVDIRRVSRDTVRYYAYMNQVEGERITVDGRVFTGITGAGTYELSDTLMAANGCDSLVTILLTVGNNVRYADTLCPLKNDYYFAPFDTVFAVGTVSGLYEHHGVKLIDGVPVDTVAYFELTILPEHQRFDTVRRCLYEVAETWPYDGNMHVSIALDGTSVTVASDTDAVVVEEVTANADYRLKMQTVSGCDSVTHLHLDLRRVSRDTVYKDMLITQLAGGEATVACHTFTGITASGTYAATDTLISSDGCDSIITVYLTVEPLHTETLCDSVLAADLTWTGNLSGYTWNGLSLPTTVGESGYYEFPGQKTIDGGPVDTVSYLQLIVNQKYESRDTVSFCLYEPTFITAYDRNSAVTITVDAGDGITVTSSDAGVAVLPMPGSVTDFALKMQTESGCDSVVFLHVDIRRVSRDTVRYYAYMNQVEGERITVDGRVFTGITGAGTYELRDTLVAANGCDSLVVHELTVKPCASGFAILCPPDVYDTLAFGDCTMTINPDRISSATVQYDVAWPFAIGNNIPSDSLFAQGDNIITWTAIDLVCGGSVSCEQHVFIAFPQCPDAVDFEGNVYHGVRVGCDCWTQRNLESKKYSDGADILGRYAYANAQYPDTAANVAVFGRLYSYESAVYDSADNGHGHIQGICPSGWYLPTPEKYTGLNAYGADALRSPDYWITGAGSNSTGFTALPAGFYNGELDRYEGLLTETYFWSTKSVFQAKPKCLYSITYYCDFVSEMHLHSGLGYSVRCVKEK